MVSTAAFHASARGSVPGLGGLKETKMFLPYPRVKVSIVGSLRDREVACSASDRQFLLAQFSLYVHKGGLRPDSFHFRRRRALLGFLKADVISNPSHPVLNLLEGLQTHRKIIFVLSTT